MSNQYPALGNSRGIPYTHAEMSKDLQVYHLSNRHHPNNLYDAISNNFVQSIEAQKNPSQNYSAKMKNLYMDQLDTCLNQYKNKQYKMNNEAEEFKKDYKQNVNGLILYMEKQGNRRIKYIQDYVKQQEARQARFIDGDKARNQKIQNHIRNNEFANLMSKSLLAQNQNKQTNQIRNSMPNHSYFNDPNQQYMSYQDKSPQHYEKALHSLSYHYNNNELQPLLPNINAYNRQDNSKKDTSKLFRVHNPITNPIQYHIDNPYIINKLQRKFGNEAR